MPEDKTLPPEPAPSESRPQEQPTLPPSAAATVARRLSVDDAVVEDADVKAVAHRYALREVLGVGGMGKVYLAHDVTLKRLVALKLIRHRDRELSARFVREAQVLGQLQHPNIVAAHELGLSQDSRLYLTMRPVPGLTLAEILADLRKGEGAAQTHSLTRLVQTFLQIALAIDFAHAKGVIHRDLKPANVMLGEHGEVQVLDWGLAKLLAESAIDPGSSPLETEAGAIAGTPVYMAPEQIVGGTVDTRSDIYALGGILYEILALRRAFVGSAGEVARAKIKGELHSPSVRSPERAIPAELERICLKAMAAEASARHASARELHDEVQHWLAQDTEHAARRAQASEKTAFGVARLDEYRLLREETRTRALEVEAARARYQPWQPVAEKADLIQLRKRLADDRERLLAVASDGVAALTVALELDPTHVPARRALTAFYFGQFLEAEAAADAARMEAAAQLVVAHDDGSRASELHADGVLSLDSSPSGAEAWLYTCVEKGPRLEPLHPRLLGVTPLSSMPLAMGRYLVVLKKPGARDVRYPVYITRGRHWSGRVNLYSDEEIGADFIYVPGGSFIRGGDPNCLGLAAPRSEPVVEDYFIARIPVTMGEVVEYLNHLAQTEPQKALERAAALRTVLAGLLATEADGSYALRDDPGAGLHSTHRLPAVMMNWYEASAYAAWRARRTGRGLRLPSDTESEKASRGVDGRSFPWGNRFDASLANTWLSAPQGSRLMSVDSFPSDVSIYGVRGVSGNAFTWTSTPVGEVAPGALPAMVYQRGGAWDGSQDWVTRCAIRYPVEPTHLGRSLGLRLACSPVPRT